MKQYLSLLLSALLVAALLAGCGRVASDGDTPEGAASSAASGTEATSSSAVSPEATSSSGVSPEVEDAASSSGVAPEVEDAASSGDASSETEDGGTSAGEASSETEAESSETELWLTIDSWDAYDAAYTFTVPEDGSYTFTVSNAEGQEVTWEVYVLEEPFEDATRYIPQAYEPCLTDSGTLSLTAGGQVYCICSVNAFTGDPLEAGSSQLLVSRTAGDVSAGAFSRGVNASADASASALVITSEDAFDGCYSFEAVESGTYLFTIENGAGHEDVTWEIYVLEEAFSESTRYIPQAYEPSLTGAGSLEIAAGSWVYCFCSVNAYTSDLDEVTGASTLTCTIQ
ncbi:MAG: hypothetical protein LUF84_07640 [Clostridiales bacterium]|nr:hypothetical protein [Clostridiales bacterium]